jgi:hypothetical protein
MLFSIHSCTIEKVKKRETAFGAHQSVTNRLSPLDPSEGFNHDYEIGTRPVPEFSCPARKENPFDFEKAKERFRNTGRSGIFHGSSRGAS